MKKFILLCVCLLTLTGCVKNRKIEGFCRDSYSFTAKTEDYTLLFTENNVTVTDLDGQSAAVVYDFHGKTVSLGNMTLPLAENSSVLELGTLISNIYGSKFYPFVSDNNEITGTYLGTDFTLNVTEDNSPKTLRWCDYTIEFTDN